MSSIPIFEVGTVTISLPSFKRIMRSINQTYISLSLWKHHCRLHLLQTYKQMLPPTGAGIYIWYWNPRSSRFAVISYLTGGSLVRKRVAEMLGEWGAASPWLLFGHSSSHAALTTDRAWLWEARQGIWGGGHRGVRYSGGGGGYRGKVRVHCILSLHVDSEQEGGWSPENVDERKSWSEWDFAPVVWRFVPSPAHVHDEVMRDPGPLTNSGQMGRGFLSKITQRAAESIRASSSSPLQRKDYHGLLREYLTLFYRKLFFLCNLPLSLNTVMSQQQLW